MLIVLDRIEEENLQDDYICEALNSIARAYRLGNHLVFAPIKLLKILKTLPKLSEFSRRIFTMMYNKFPSSGGYLRNFSVRISIVPEDDVLELRKIMLSQGEVDEILISARMIANSDVLSKTVLLGENHSDTKFYDLVAKSHINETRLSGVTIKFDPNGGGGGSTVDEYNYIQNERSRICLCVLDSDKRYPEAEPGGTFTNVEAIDDGDIPITKLIMVETLEIENMIPTKVIEKLLGRGAATCGPLIAHRKIVDSPLSAAIQFIDYKKGVKLVELAGSIMPQGHIDYWTPVAEIVIGQPVSSELCNKGMVCTKKQCTCQLIPGYGDSILDKVMPHFDSLISLPVKEWVDISIENEWRKIGALITSWCCGSILKAI